MILKPIGTIHTPFNTQSDTPIQPFFSKGARGTVELNTDLTEGLSDLGGFSHIYLIYQFHLSEGYDLKVVPFLDEEERGVFATRAPRRPNPIGISVVKLLNINDNILEVENVDMVDGTPLLDIKPYVSSFEPSEDEKNGWLDEKIKK